VEKWNSVGGRVAGAKPIARLRSGGPVDGAWCVSAVFDDNFWRADGGWGGERGYMYVEKRCVLCCEVVQSVSGRSVGFSREKVLWGRRHDHA
jgi:hypothetical protein